MATTRMNEYYKYMVEDELFDNRLKAKRIHSARTVADLFAEFEKENRLRTSDKRTKEAPFMIEGEEWMGSYTWEDIIEELRETVNDLEGYGPDRKIHAKITLNLKTEMVQIDYIENREHDLVLVIIGEMTTSIQNSLVLFLSLGNNYNAIDLEIDGDSKVAKYKGLRIEVEIIEGLPF